VFHPEMHAPILERLEIETELRTAIEHGDLRVHYQPIVELPSGRITALEALVRWEHPRRGLIPPDQFIPVAEASGLIHQIGTVVLNEACAALQSLQPSIHGPVYVAVNLSAAQFESPNLPQLVAGALRSSGLAPELLVLEITETVVMADTEATVERLRALKRLGVRVAIDDFGTGYSSLSYLRRFPVDVLKIDRAFVRNVDGSTEDSALAQAILKLAQTFKLEAVAEGIERAGQLDALVEMGCRFGQGFYFARPQPIEDIEQLLHRHSGIATA
jgi:EAL domain-containing protein (putative c-di-GMP-specific phosphodiesterase class I)